MCSVSIFCRACGFDTPLSLAALAGVSPAPPRGEPSHHRQQRQSWRSGKAKEKFASPQSFSLFTGVTWLPLRGHEQRPRPADETGSCEWRSAPIFAKAFMPAAKMAKRKRSWHRVLKLPVTERAAKRKAPAFADALIRPFSRFLHLYNFSRKENVTALPSTPSALRKTFPHARRPAGGGSVPG